MIPKRLGSFQVRFAICGAIVPRPCSKSLCQPGYAPWVFCKSAQRIRSNHLRVPSAAAL